MEFLKTIHESKYFYETELLNRAIRRYETVWLPFLNANSDDIEWIPPLDVAWIWHVHMLNPTSYLKDCTTLYGKIFGHKFIEPSMQQSTEAKTRLMWANSCNVPYDFLDDVAVEACKPSRLSYDLKLASVRQSKFYYQVSLPHFKDKAFLSIGIVRYKKFLYLKKLNPNEFLVPCYLIDIVWHTHQLHPLEYKHDTEKILGLMLSHDDSVDDRTPGSQLCTSDAKTRELWSKVC